MRSIIGDSNAPRKKGGLGRGLDSLIPSTPLPHIENSSGVVVADRAEVDINSISPNPKQPRTVFDEDALNELAARFAQELLLPEQNLRYWW